jgi:hypothetical protein
MTDFEWVEEQRSDLYEYIIRVIRPLRIGGEYTENKALFNASIEGRHYGWMRRNTDIDHLRAEKYARILTANNIETTTMIHRLQTTNNSLLTQLKIPIEDSETLIKAVKAELEFNLSAENTNAIEAVLVKEREAMLVVAEREAVRRQFFVDQELLLREAVAMQNEDAAGHKLRSDFALDKRRMRPDGWSFLGESDSDAKENEAHAVGHLQLLNSLLHEHGRSLADLQDEASLPSYITNIDILNVDQKHKALRNLNLGPTIDFEAKRLWAREIQTSKQVCDAMRLIVYRVQVGHAFE